jgi:hypothetical protein
MRDRIVGSLHGVVEVESISLICAAEEFCNAIQFVIRISPGVAPADAFNGHASRMLFSLSCRALTS